MNFITYKNLKCILLLLFQLICSVSISQNIPISKYSQIHSYRDFRENLTDEKTNLFGVNYNHTSYLTSFYGEEVRKGNINYVFGSSIDYRKYIAKQILMDVEFFCNLFKTISLSILNYGVEATGGFVLIPFSYKLTKIFQPYITAGYQLSAMKITKATETYVLDYSKGKSTHTSAPIWKAGLMIYLSKSVFFNAQYKQSISSSFDRNFNSWGIGVGYKF